MSIEKKKVFIVDDHQIMIDGIKSLLKIKNQFDVVGSTMNPLDALELIGKTNPDIVITDINMEALSGIELSKKIKKQFPAIKILALTMFSDKTTINEMIDAGVEGYILKNTGTDELQLALQKIADGHLFFSNEVTQELINTIKNKTNISSTEEEAKLTPREIEITKQIADEYTNEKIGEKLFISERTVETHRKNIFRKTNTKSVAGLIKYAINNKII